MKYTKGDTIVSFEKLWYLQKNHAGRYASVSPQAPIKPSQDLTELALKPIIKLLDERSAREDMCIYTSIPEGSLREDYVHSILWADAQNYTVPHEFINRNIYFFSAPSISKLEATIPALKLRQVPPIVSFYEIPPRIFISLINNVCELDSVDWNRTNIKFWINWVIDQGAHLSLADVEEVDETIHQTIRKAWNKTVHQYLRWAFTTGKPGPDCAETMRILGKEETSRRLKVGRDILLRRDEKNAGGEELDL
jgi:glutamyl-tRNA synthetase